MKTLLEHFNVGCGDDLAPFVAKAFGINKVPAIEYRAPDSSKFVNSPTGIIYDEHTEKVWSYSNPHWQQISGVSQGYCFNYQVNGTSEFFHVSYNDGNSEDRTQAYLLRVQMQEGVRNTFTKGCEYCHSQLLFWTKEMGLVDQYEFLREEFKGDNFASPHLTSGWYYDVLDNAKRIASYV